VCEHAGRSMDYLIVGLGNPGDKYDLTRHNAGFLVVDQLAIRYLTQNPKPAQKRSKFNHECNALCGWFRLKETVDIKEDSPRLLLAKPLTYMNLSGNAVFALLKKYAIPLSRAIIVYDDLSLPFGVLRLRAKGSSGGHKGMASVIAKTGPEIVRLKIGIGVPPEGMSHPDYVLSDFSPTELKMLSEITCTAGEAIIDWVRNGTEKAMSIYNGVVPSLSES